MITKDSIEMVSSVFHFHNHNHEVLATFLLQELSKHLDFQLKIQKASIQLLYPEPFAVIGFRRSQQQIFVEFYHASAIEHERIAKTVESKRNRIINRVNIASIDEINTELVQWISDSYHILT